MPNVLFKGKRKMSGEWVKGFYIFCPAVGDKSEKHYIQTIANDGNIGYLVEVIPETVGQYSTLDDVHGDGIFTGDKLRAFINDGTYEGYAIDDFEVVFESGEFCLRTKYGDTYPIDTEDVAVKFKVVGNVHDEEEQ